VRVCSRVRKLCLCRAGSAGEMALTSRPSSATARRLPAAAASALRCWGTTLKVDPVLKSEGDHGYLYLSDLNYFCSYLQVASAVNTDIFMWQAVFQSYTKITGRLYLKVTLKSQAGDCVCIKWHVFLFFLLCRAVRGVLVEEGRSSVVGVKLLLPHSSWVGLYS